MTGVKLMTKHRKKYNQTRTFGLVLLGLAGLAACITMLITGTDIRLFNPKGLMAEQQLNLGLFTMLLLFTISVPTLIILYGFAWHFRETNDKAEYNAQTRHGKLFNFSIWALPAVFMIVLALVVWPATHRLEPRKSIASDVKPLRIQVVAMRWKWLFIYPEQNIATVNYIQVPVGTPIEFDLTADETPMSSFWIPHLGGQLYAMTGHVNRLNLIAGEPGDYPGSSAEINGRGFAGMKFTARATSQAEFNEWIENSRTTSSSLDEAAYKELVKPSENNKVAIYSSLETDLFSNLLMKYMGSHGQSSTEQESSGH